MKGQTLGALAKSFKVPEQEKQEVLAAFGAQQGRGDGGVPSKLQVAPPKRAHVSTRSRML